MEKINTHKIFKNKDKSRLLMPAKLSLAACLVLAALGISIGTYFNYFLILISGSILFAESFRSLYNLFLITESIRLPEVNFQYGYGKYESLASYTTLLLSFFLTFFTIFILDIKRFTWSDNAFLPCILYLILIYIVSLRLINAENDLFLKFSISSYKNDAWRWKIIGRSSIILIFLIILDYLIPGFAGEPVSGIIRFSLSIVPVLGYLFINLMDARSHIERLLDKALPEEIQYEILAIISENINRICEYRGIHTRRSGENIFIDMEIVMPYDYTLEETAKIEKILKKAIQEKIPEAIPRVYYTPCAKDCIYHGSTHCPVKKEEKKKDLPEK